MLGHKNNIKLWLKKEGRYPLEDEYLVGTFCEIHYDPYVETIFIH